MAQTAQERKALLLREFSVHGLNARYPKVYHQKYSATLPPKLIRIM